MLCGSPRHPLIADQVQRVRDDAVQPVLAYEAPPPVGAVASFDWIGISSDEIVVSSRVLGDGARHALLAVER